MAGSQMRQLLDALIDAGALNMSKSGAGRAKQVCYSLAIKTEQTVGALKQVPLYGNILADGPRAPTMIL